MTTAAEAKPTGAEWKATKTCFLCNQVGHIKSECPNAKQSGTPKRNGAIAMRDKKKRGPYLAVDVSALGQVEGPVLRMMARMDGGQS